MATSTSALSSLETMRGSGDENTAADDGLASPPPLPPRGRRPSRYTAVRAGGSRTTTTVTPPSPSREDASTTTDDYSLLLAELEQKAAEVEARLRLKEEENAELKRRIESYHVEWLKCEIKIKSLEEACQEQTAALQAVQDAKARADDEMARDRRESLESLMKMPEDPSSSARLRHGRDRAVVVGGRRSAVTTRLGSESRRQQSQALVVVEPSRPWQPAVPSANPVDDLEKLKAQFCAWKKDYKARLRRAKAGLDKDRRRRGGCWI